ncbi:MAG TPA: dTDP-4-dehydrorhamnose reductase [Acidimicrobiales bacterium]|nr:dTDP-4-dehydrorhamnose reductase [Acidimicrobiales bacterium]
MKPKVLVTGAAGQLGTEVVAHLATRRAEVIGITRAEVDLTRRDLVRAAVSALGPEVVIHTAAWTAVDDCESDPERAFLVNTLSTRNLAEAARATGAHLCLVSTDYVFDGATDRPYLEWDTPNPLSVYGRSKLAAEAELDPSSTIVRTAWLFGEHGSNFVKTMLRLSQQSDVLRVVDDQHGCPTAAADLARAMTELALGRHPGVHHVTNQGAATWYELARQTMVAAGLPAERIEPISTKELDPPRPAPRPEYSVLDNFVLRQSGLDLLPDWRESLHALVPRLLSQGGTVQ